MRAIVVLFASLWMCVDCNHAEASPATDAIKVCAPYRGLIADAAEAASVPAALLTALVFAESTCRADAVNKRTGAVSLGQILPTGSAAKGHSEEELKKPEINLALTASHIALWKRRCGTWVGAISVFNGAKRCSAHSDFAKNIVTMWKQIRRIKNAKPITS